MTAKKTQRLREGKGRDLHYSCQVYQYCTSLMLHIWLNGPLFLLNLNALARFLRLQTTE